MSKLCPHFQTLPRWASKVQYPGAWVKVCDPGAGIQGRFPGKRIVGRWYMQDEERFIRAGGGGALGAESYYRQMLPHYQETRGEVAVIEAVNEPGCHDEDQVGELLSFLRRWIALAHTDGFTVAVPAFSVGNPAEWVMGAMADVWAATDYASLHEYGTRRMDEEWCMYTSLRHRMLNEQMCIQCGQEMPPLLIRKRASTAAGMATGTSRGRHSGRST